jgi:hypothetical protein
MPTYTFTNTETGEDQNYSMPFAELEQFKANNPNLKQKLVFPGSIGSTSMDSGKLPEGFKDKLREIQKKHPRANGIKHLI